MTSFFCLWLPDFAAWAAQRHDPLLVGKAVLIYQSGRITAASPAARQAGAQVGWTLHRAQSQLPDAVCLPLYGPAVNAAWQEVIAALLDLTPCLESQRPGLLIADVRPPRIVLPLLRRWGAQGGVADDRAKAELAAFTTAPGTLRTVREANAARFLRRIPLSTLTQVGLRSDTLERLAWFGWRFVGDLAPLSLRQLRAQFDQGPLLYRYAQATDVRPVGFHRALPTVHAAFTFETPIREPHEWEPVLALLLDQCLAALQERGAQSVGVQISTDQGIRRAHRLLHDLSLEKRPLYETARRLLLELLDHGDSFNELRIQLGQLAMLTPTQGLLFGRQRVPVQVAVRAVEEKYPGALRRIVMLDRRAYLPEAAFRLEPVTLESVTAPPKIPKKPKRQRAQRKKSGQGPALPNALL